MKIPLYNPTNPKKKGRMIVSASVSPEFFQLAQTHNISWSEAMRIGISMILAERGVMDYDNRLNIVRNLQKTITRLNETVLKLEEYESKLEPGK